MNKNIDEDGHMMKGRYKGELVEDVASEDPEYLEWLLKEKDDLEYDERVVIEEALGIQSDE